MRLCVVESRKSLYKSIAIVEANTADLTTNEESDIVCEVEKAFVNAMDNDFNTALVIAHLFQYANRLNKLIHERQYAADKVKQYLSSHSIEVRDGRDKIEWDFLVHTNMSD